MEARILENKENRIVRAEEMLGNVVSKRSFIFGFNGF